MRIPKLIALFAILMLTGLSFATTVGDDFMSRIRQAQSEDEAQNLINEYIAKTADVQDLSNIQDVWQMINPEGCLGYFANQHNQNPKSKEYYYLWARVLDDKYQRLVEGRQIVKKNRKKYWGYELVATVYNRGLFYPEEAYVIDKSKLEADLAADGKIFAEMEKKFPTEDLTIYTMYNMYNWKKDYPNAEKYLIKAAVKPAEWLSPDLIVAFTLAAKSFDAFKSAFPAMIGSAVKSGEVEAADSTKIYTYYYLDLLKKTENWKEVDAYFAQNKNELDNRERYPLLISLNISKNQFDRAIDYIETLVREDKVTFKFIESNKEWSVLSGAGQKWLKMMYEAKLKWDNGAEGRKEEALKNIVSKDAFMWELPDTTGNIVKLADQKGSIVILDFWATWCNPCRLAMPVLDNWMKKKMPAGVKVYSVNVWEKDPPQAKTFFAEKAYGMTLLMGSNDLAQSYNFDGIPFICVIDKTGKIRFEEKGYTDDLDEKLATWVSALQSE